MLTISKRLISQAIPIDGVPGGQIQDTDVPEDSMPTYAERPPFTVSAMSNNFRRFNARIGVIFKFQARVIRLLSWRHPSQTLCFLGIYTIVCVDPYLICVLPPVAVLLGVLVPSFLARHPAPPFPAAPSSYSPRGPPLAPARTVKPVKELSRAFFRNMRDLQNSMEDFSVLHDRVVSLVVPKTNFSDEALSSAVFVLLCAGAALAPLAAHHLPWRPIFLLAGWLLVCSGHPAASRLLRRAAPPSTAGGGGGYHNPGLAARSRLDAWARRDILLDSAPDTREVEIFELQRLSADATGEWEPWLFTPSPYDPLSAPRIAGSRPIGARFFEDVLPPDGWEWSGKKWALDLWSREWVEERIITGVEVETEGQRWVYDIFNEHEATAGIVESPAPPRLAAGLAVPSWEEGEEGMGRRGEWRRRRWVRLVRREKVAASGGAS